MLFPLLYQLVGGHTDTVAYDFYKNLITREIRTATGLVFVPIVHSGWLYYDAPARGWRIRPCQYARIGYAAIKAMKDPKTEQPAGLDPTRSFFSRDRAKSKRLLHCRFERPVLAPQIRHGLNPHRLLFAEVKTAYACGDTKAELKDPVEGFLVFTGDVAAKKRQFVFHTPAPDEAIVEVSAQTMRDFLSVHPETAVGGNGQTAAWGHWKNALLNGDAGPASGNEPGAPVFYIADSSGRPRPATSSSSSARHSWTISRNSPRPSTPNVSPIFFSRSTCGASSSTRSMPVRT